LARRVRVIFMDRLLIQVIIMQVVLHKYRQTETLLKSVTTSLPAIRVEF